MNGLLRPVGRLLGFRQARAKAYLLLGLVVGILWFVLVSVPYVYGFTAQSVLIGIPFLAGTQLLLRPIGRFERLLVRSLLGQDVPAPEPIRYERSTGSRFSGLVNLARRVYAVAHDGQSWRVLVWTLVRSVAGPVGFVAVVLRVMLPVLLVLAPLLLVVDVLAGDAASADVSIEAGWRYCLLLGPAGLVVLIPLGRAIGALVTLHRRLAVWALGPGRAEIEAAALARAAAAEEQVRIDQELHDSIGHMLSMIVVQAGAGAHVFDKDPDFARNALGTIERRGRAALGELDRIISNLRGAEADNAPRPAGAGRHAPLPGGEDLPALIAGAREAGMDVVARIRVGELSPALGRAVYRIVQEALTNAAKHAPGGAVTVDVVAGGEAVAVSVVNKLSGGLRERWPQPGACGQGQGHGLASIRDRATLLGGAATVGATGDGEFAVRAVMPLAAMLPDGASTRCTFTPGCDCLGCAIRHSVPMSQRVCGQGPAARPEGA